MINTKFEHLQTTINNLNLEIFEHGYVIADSTWKFSNIQSPFNRLYFITEGEGILRNDKHQIILQPFHIYLIPIHSTYDYLCDVSMKKLYLHFRLEHLPGLDAFVRSNQCLSLATNPKLINQLLVQSQSQQIYDTISFKALILNILSDFIKTYQITLTVADPLLAYQPLFQFIKEHGHAHLSIPSLAEHCNMSYETLSKNFKSDLGITLKQYLNSKLIEKSKELLLVTSLTIKQIAYQLHFTDEFYFSKFFKKHCSISPSEYRRRYKI